MTSQLDDFIATIAKLRGPDGCPWDREQTHLTLGRYLLEESYEVLEAIHAEDPAKLKEELGDLLLQIVLNAKVAEDSGHFDIQDIARSINEKMIKRHPHVFAAGDAKTSDQVVQRWEEIKQEEAQERGEVQSVVDSVPKALPALLKALKVSEKAVSVGFEWDCQEDVWDKLLSEINELKEELSRPKEKQNKRDIELELGDVLFTLVNVARWQQVNPEESLLLAIDKFRTRFRKMEEISEAPLKDLNLQQLDEIWVKSKKLTGHQSSQT